MTLLALAGAGVSVAGLAGCGVPVWGAALTCVALTGLAWPSHGLRAGVVLAPAVALVLPGGVALAAALGLGAAALGVAALMPAKATPGHDSSRADRDRLERINRRYPLLMEACLELSSARQFDHLASLLAEQATEVVPEALAVRVFLGTASEIRCCASRDAQGATCALPPGPEHAYVAGEARELVLRKPGGTCVLVPLRADRRSQQGQHATLRGVLAVDLPPGGAGERETIDLLAALGRLGGLGLAAVDLVDQARGLALRDELTGLLGRHEFLRRLDELMANARRHRSPLAIVACDLDHLKRYNDSHGHAAGDAALVAVAEAMRRTAPRDAMLCRWGGEEFALALPGAGLDRAASAADHLRAAIAACVPDPQHPDRRVTASLGTAQLGPDDTAAVLLERADAALYRAKANGRNRVEAG